MNSSVISDSFVIEGERFPGSTYMYMCYVQCISKCIIYVHTHTHLICQPC